MINMETGRGMSQEYEADQPMSLDEARQTFRDELNIKPGASEAEIESATKGLLEKGVDYIRNSPRLRRAVEIVVVALVVGRAGESLGASGNELDKREGPPAAAVGHDQESDKGQEQEEVKKAKTEFSREN